MWTAFFAVVCIGVLIFVIHYLFHTKIRSKNIVYTSQYSQLIQKVEDVTTKVNLMQALVDHVNDEKVLDYYEAGLKLLESLLTMINELPNLSDEPAEMRTAFYLAGRCEDQVDRTFLAFKKVLSCRTM